MLDRRTLLRAAGGALLGTTVAGCALSPGGPTVQSLTSPSSSLLPGQTALQTLLTNLDAAHAGSWPEAHAAVIRWACSVVRDQCTAVSLTTPTPIPPAGIQADAVDDTARTALVDALGTAQATFRAQALDDSSARPLVWAAMSAWAEATVGQLAEPTALLEPARSWASPAPQGPTAALQASLDAAEQTVYGLGLIAGTPGLSDADRAELAARRVFWLGLRDTLTAEFSAPATPTPAAPWYELDRPADTTTAHEACAQLQGKTLPILGRSIAYAPPAVRPTLVDALANTARDVPEWGGLVERWPGLPPS